MKLHSAVDLITNSSTTIYTSVPYNAIPVLYKGLNKVLEVIGDTRKAEDLFDIKIEFNTKSYWYEDLVEEWEDYSYEEKAIFGTLDKFIEEQSSKEEWEWSGDHKVIKVYTKEGTEIDLHELIDGIYHLEARYDG